MSCLSNFCQAYTHTRALLACGPSCRVQLRVAERHGAGCAARGARRGVRGTGHAARGARHGSRGAGCAARVTRQRLAEETAWYCRGVRKRLVLWDVDHTLVNAGGLSPHLYVLVFAELFGRKLEEVAPMAGRTDRAIILDTLSRAGVPHAAQQVCAFATALTTHAPEFADRVRERGRALPGAVRVLQTLAASGGKQVYGTSVVQSVLTGNLRPLAEAKLGALDLAEYLDLDIGAYGDAHEDRAQLVHLARDNAARVHGMTFPGEETVLVGDTPLDVAAALETGARSVAVATGATPAPELAASGAHVVLPDLTDTKAVVTAVLA